MRSINIKFVVMLLLLGIMLFQGSNSSGLLELNEDQTVKNIILIIGDGMGFEQLKLASLVEYGNESGLYMQSASFVQTSAETSSFNQLITDSAASATAIATGYKTLNGAIGKDSNLASVQTILEYAETLGKSTGLVSSMRFNDATPASFAAHQTSRNNLDAIAAEMGVAGIEVVLGGGTDWTPTNSILTNQNYTIVTTKNELLNIDTNVTTKLWGNYLPRNILYEADMNYSVDVRLSDMVPKNIEILNNNPLGFFTMIESGLIDFAGHGSFEPSNKTRNALETIHLDQIIKYMMDWIVLNPDTLVIVTADHETGGLTVEDSSNLDAVLPNLNYTEEQKQLRRIERSKQIDVSWSTTYHTSQNIPLMAFGKNADLLINPTCDYSNANVYGIIKNAMDGIIPTQCPVFIPGFQNATITTSSSTTTTTTSTQSITSSSDITSSTISTSTSTSQSTSDENDSSYPQLFIMVIVFLSPRMFRKGKK